MFKALGGKKYFKKRAVLQALMFVLLLALVFVIFYQKVEFSSSDLGRHLENGRLVFSQGELLRSNFYSYTETSHPFINHHWAAGLIFFAIYSIGGFKLLSIFNILLGLVIFSLFFLLAKKRSNFLTAALLSLPVIFLLSGRVEPRPEMFSYLFLALAWLVLESKKLSDKKRLFILFPLFVIWANTHIYFFLGLALLFFAGLDRLIKEKMIPFKLNKKEGRRFWQKARFQILLFFSLVFAAAISPNHFKGLLYPLNILREYGYQIAENKSVFFLSNISANPNYLLFKLLLILLFVSLLANYFLLKNRSIFDYMFAIFISALALVFSRNLALFSLVALVIISPSLAYVLKLIAKWLDCFLKKRVPPIYWRNLLACTYLILLVFSLGFLIRDLDKRQLFLYQESGLGLSEGSLEVFEYYRQKDLKGPIYNNYDTGSAINFGLSGSEKVFVDNRPEAYSLSFFKDVYIPMQEDKDVWGKYLENYKFKTIIFSHTDNTPWAKKFISSILQDSKWALVYFDPYYIVLLNKDEYSEDFISKNTISQADFISKIRNLSKEGSLNVKFSLANFSQLVGYDYLAKEIYQKIILDYPDRQRALFALAGLYSKSSSDLDLNKALSYYKKGQNSGLKVPAIYQEMGLISWRLNDYNRAQEYFKKAAKRGDKNSKDYLKQINKLKKDNLLP